MFIFALVLAAGCLVASLWLRRDTPASRSWETQEGIVDERFAFVFLPAITLFLAGIGLIGLAGLLGMETVAVKVLFWFAMAITLVGIVGSVIGLFSNRYPEWLLPQWRKNSPHRK